MPRARCIWVQLWDAVLLCSTPGPHPAQCPLGSPLSWSPPGSGSDAVQRLFTSSDPRLRLRRQWLAVTPIMLLTQPPAPAQYHIEDDDMTGWQSDYSLLLSELPCAAYPDPNWSKWPDLSLSSPTLLFVYTTYSRHVLTRRSRTMLNWFLRNFYYFHCSLTHLNWKIYVYQNSSEGFFENEWDMRMTLRNVRYCCYWDWLSLFLTPSGAQGVAISVHLSPW